MATLGNIYGHLIRFTENYRVWIKNEGGNGIEDISVEIDNGSSVLSGTTNEDGYIDFKIDTGESLDYDITYTVPEGSDYSSGETSDTHSGVDFYVTEIVLVGPPTIYHEPEEKYNFIRFHGVSNFFVSGGVLGSLDSESSFQAITNSVQSYYECEGGLPNNYKRNERYYQPPFIHGDEVSIILNFVADFEGESIANVKVAITDNYGVIQLDNIDLNETTCSTIDYHQFDLEVPAALKVASYYRFVIYNTSTGAVFYMSNPFRVSDDPNKYPILVYKNSTDIFGYPYECLSSDDTTIRLDFNLVDEQSELEIKSIKEESTGIIRTQKVNTAKVLTFDCYYFDRWANDAMLALSAHDSIELNGRVMKIKTAYKTKPNRRNSRHFGEIEFYDQGYSTVNYKN